MEEGIISESKSKVRIVSSDEEGSDFGYFDKSKGKPLHDDIDNEITEGNEPTLALLPSRLEKEEVNRTVRHGIETVISTYADPTEHLNHRND